MTNTFTFRDPLVARTVKYMPVMQETQVQSLGREDPLEKKMATTSVFLPGEFHGQRRLVGYHPWGCRVRHDRVTITFRRGKALILTLAMPGCGDAPSLDTWLKPTSPPFWLASPWLLPAQHPEVQPAMDHTGLTRG